MSIMSPKFFFLSSRVAIFSIFPQMFFEFSVTRAAKSPSKKIVSKMGEAAADKHVKS